jgi:hypothetical protein
MDDFLTIGKTIEYLEEENSLGYIYQLIDLHTYAQFTTVKDL